MWDQILIHLLPETPLIFTALGSATLFAEKVKLTSQLAQKHRDREELIFWPEFSGRQLISVCFHYDPKKSLRSHGVYLGPIITEVERRKTRPEALKFPNGETSDLTASPPWVLTIINSAISNKISIDTPVTFQRRKYSQDLDKGRADYQ